MNATRASTESRGARRVSPPTNPGPARGTHVVPRSYFMAALLFALAPFASPVHAQNSFAENTSGITNPEPGRPPPGNPAYAPPGSPRGSPSPSQPQTLPPPPGTGPRMPAPAPAPSNQPMPMPPPMGNQSGSGVGYGYSGATGAGSDPRFAPVEQMESEDFGVPPTDQLRQDQFHAPTPTRIPGGLVITTGALNTLYQQNQGQFLVFDVLGGPEGLPGAQNARPAGQGGSFKDPNQREFGNYLQGVTQGNKQMPLVFYCQNNYCWLSYNAALRAINLGYTQVLWYRGGIEAWQQAGLPVYPRGY